MLIKGTAEKSAEMVTDEGAIYVTSNMGYNWKAAVEETVSATLNRCLVLKSKTLLFVFFWNLYLCPTVSIAMVSGRV